MTVAANLAKRLSLRSVWRRATCTPFCILCNAPVRWRSRVIRNRNKGLVRRVTKADEARRRRERESAAARREALERVGERLRWLREAYEAREPLRHSQAQWARVLRITPEMLNRIELGRTQAPMHVLQRLIYYLGASPGYVLFGVVQDGYMVRWLEQALIQAHPGELSTLPKFREDRAKNLQAIEALPERESGKGRRRYRRPAPREPGDDTAS